MTQKFEFSAEEISAILGQKLCDDGKLAPGGYTLSFEIDRRSGTLTLCVAPPKGTAK